MWASWVSWPEGSMGGIVGVAPAVGLVFSLSFSAGRVSHVHTGPCTELSGDELSVHLLPL